MPSSNWKEKLTGKVMIHTGQTTFYFILFYSILSESLRKYYIVIIRIRTIYTYWPAIKSSHCVICQYSNLYLIYINVLMFTLHQKYLTVMVQKNTTCLEMLHSINEMRMMNTWLRYDMCMIVTEGFPCVGVGCLQVVWLSFQKECTWGWWKCPRCESVGANGCSCLCGSAIKCQLVLKQLRLTLEAVIG